MNREPNGTQNILLTQQIKGVYNYKATSFTADTVGDTRTSNQSGVEYLETCTVANVAKAGGTWVVTETKQTVSLVDNNMQYVGVVPQTAGAFISLQSGKSGMGKIIIGDALEFAYFIFTTAGVVTLQVNSTNVVTTETDAKLCITDGGSLVYIVNELGSTLIATVTINYNS